MKRSALQGLFLAAVVTAPLATARAGSYGTELPFAAGVGARASGLGLAGASFPSSPSAQYFNPAVIAGLSYRELELYRTTLFDSDAQYYALTYVHPTLGHGTLAASILRLDVGGIEERDALNNLLSTDTNNSQSRILLGYAANLHANLSAGFNLKIDHQAFGDVSGTGVGADIGLLARRRMSDTGFLRTIRAGFAAENLVEPSVKLDEEDVGDPMRLTLGGSFDAQLGEFGLVTALDVASPRFSPVRVRFGQEVRYADAVALRVGLDGTTPTYGLGASYRHVHLDYAFRDEDLGMNHRVSLSVAFGASVDERAAQRRERVDTVLRENVAQRVSEFEAEQIVRMLASADSLFSSGSYEQARDQYEMVLVLNPSQATARARLPECSDRLAAQTADALMAKGDFLTALYHLRQVTTPGPAVSARIAECERRVRDTRDRTTLTERTLKSAIDLYAAGRFAEALAAFDEVLRIDPNNALAREYRAKSRANIDAQVGSLLKRAREMATKGHYDAAIALFADALAMRPGDAAIQKEVADVERRRQAAPVRREEAPASGAGVPVDARVLDDKYERGINRFEAGEFEEAARLLLEVWTVSPNYRNVADPLAKAYLFVGMKVYSREQYTEAIRIWEKVLTIDPGNVKAQRYLQKTLEEASRLSSAQR